jgi:protein O-GlcNAc transferase
MKSSNNSSLNSLTQQAVSCHKSGRYGDADRLYQQILRLQPDHFDALHLSGVLACQNGDPGKAVALITRAVKINPKSVVAVYNLGEAHRMLDQLEEAARCYLQAVTLKPDYAVAWNSLGMVRQKSGELSQAHEAYLKAVDLMPDSAEVQNNLGTLLHDMGYFREAEEAYHRALLQHDDYAEAQNNLGTLLRDLDRDDEAEAAFRRALILNPESPEIHNNLGTVLLNLNRPEESAEECRRALQLKPDHADAHANLGAALNGMGQRHEARTAFNMARKYKADLAETYNDIGARLQTLGSTRGAEKAYTLAVLLKPGYAEAHSNRGLLYHGLGRFEEAIREYRQAISYKTDFVEAYNNLGAALKNLGRLEEAEQALQHALALKPDHARTHSNLGNIFEQKGRLVEAEAAHRKALELMPDYPEAYNNLGIVLRGLGRTDEAVDAFLRSLELKPELAEVHNNLGSSYESLGRRDDAIGHYRQAVELNPDYHSARCNLVYQLLHTCQWEKGLEEHIRILCNAVRTEGASSRARISPFAFSSLPGSTADEQKSCAMAWASSLLAPLNQVTASECLLEADLHGTIHIGYLSADFFDHVVARHFVEVLERHDRRRFIISAYSYTPDDGSELRRRLVQAVDSFVDLHQASHEEAAEIIRKDRIQILVDLTGYTAQSRSAILAFRPAPIQVNYLGYPGTMGTKFVDYLIADNFIIPPELEKNYLEQVVRLPGSYLPNDGSRSRPEPLRRSDCGLPDEAIVFCCFNQAYKITPQLFDIWCRLLKAVPDSVLWLRAFNPFVEENFQREAEKRGIRRDRIIMAPSVAATVHLARLACADIFLDTFPYNAHATCSDALWMGVPVITCSGETFPSRVAGSLLQTLGVPELITFTPEEYYKRALTVATDQQERERLGNIIRAKRETSPLYDSSVFTRGLETLYEQMIRNTLSSSKPAPSNTYPEKESSRTLLIEGWHFIPHSYAVVNQFQCLQLLQLTALRLVHRDIPYFDPSWQPVDGLFPPADEAAIRNIPLATPDEHPDVLLRIAYPYNYAPSRAKRTYVFGTAEYGCVPPHLFVGAESLQQVMSETDITLITSSNWSRQGFIRSGAYPDRVVVIPLGVDPELFHPLEYEQRQLVRSELGWKGFTFLSLGAMTGNKGIPLLLKAFAIVAQRHPDTKLVLKGLNGLYDSRGRLKQLVSELTSDEVRILEPRLIWLENTMSFADIARLYQGADAYVSPYLAEGFNMPVLEAAACGTLVICTRGGSTDDFTTPEFTLHINSQARRLKQESGLFYHFREPNLEHLLHQMCTAIDSPDIRARARQAGPAFIRERFTWKQVTTRLMETLFPANETF